MSLPICVHCGREMYASKNGVVVYHPMEHPSPDEKVRTETKGVVIINVDVMLEGSWKDGDLDFVVNGDEYECRRCHSRIVVGFVKEMIAGVYSQDELQLMVKEALKHNAAVKITRK